MHEMHYDDAPVIFNHITARLSDIDMQMVRAVPEGGNWKNIPPSIPSRRLERIRESFMRGEGSRSTYYGRLRRDRPAYTINTYFTRPGNGCHIHYDQDRVLSHREAARLQSFPDNFEFVGSKSSIATQIGNAVPPLLAYQLAKSLGPPGTFVDLFCGAGGFGLGFVWAGWRPLVANDIEPSFVATYARNVHGNAIVGSITDRNVFDGLIAEVRKAASAGEKVWILGGPPCQGFSTAGGLRSMRDPRNLLFRDYVRLLAALRPDGFIFENVTGLLNMQAGAVFAKVRKAFSSSMPYVYDSVLSAEEYAIPQRRKRVLIVGAREQALTWAPPKKVTGQLSGSSVAPCISVQDAISDLPPLRAGEDGDALPYRTPPRTNYQRLMRRLITPCEYLEMTEWRRE